MTASEDNPNDTSTASSLSARSVETASSSSSSSPPGGGRFQQHHHQQPDRGGGGGAVATSYPPPPPPAPPAHLPVPTVARSTPPRTPPLFPRKSPAASAAATRGGGVGNNNNNNNNSTTPTRCSSPGGLSTVTSASACTTTSHTTVAADNRTSSRTIAMLRNRNHHQQNQNQNQLHDHFLRHNQRENQENLQERGGTSSSSSDEEEDRRTPQPHPGLDLSSESSSSSDSSSSRQYQVRRQYPSPQNLHQQSSGESEDVEDRAADEQAGVDSPDRSCRSSATAASSSASGGDRHRNSSQQGISPTSPSRSYRSSSSSASGCGSPSRGQHVSKIIAALERVVPNGGSGEGGEEEGGGGGGGPRGGAPRKKQQKPGGVRSVPTSPVRRERRDDGGNNKNTGGGAADRSSASLPAYIGAAGGGRIRRSKSSSSSSAGVEIKGAVDISSGQDSRNMSTASSSANISGDMSSCSDSRNTSGGISSGLHSRNTCEGSCSANTSGDISRSMSRGSCSAKTSGLHSSGLHSRNMSGGSCSANTSGDISISSGGSTNASIEMKGGAVDSNSGRGSRNTSRGSSSANTSGDTSCSGSSNASREQQQERTTKVDRVEGDRPPPVTVNPCPANNGCEDDDVAQEKQENSEPTGGQLPAPAPVPDPGTELAAVTPQRHKVDSSYETCQEPPSANDAGCNGVTIGDPSAMAPQEETDTSTSLLRMDHIVLVDADDYSASLKTADTSPLRRLDVRAGRDERQPPSPFQVIEDEHDISAIIREVDSKNQENVVSDESFSVSKISEPSFADSLPPVDPRGALFPDIKQTMNPDNLRRTSSTARMSTFSTTPSSTTDVVSNLSYENLNPIKKVKKPSSRRRSSTSGRSIVSSSGRSDTKSLEKKRALKRSRHPPLSRRGHRKPKQSKNMNRSKSSRSSSKQSEKVVRVRYADSYYEEDEDDSELELDDEEVDLVEEEEEEEYSEYSYDSYRNESIDSREDTLVRAFFDFLINKDEESVVSGDTETVDDPSSSAWSRKRKQLNDEDTAAGTEASSEGFRGKHDPVMLLIKDIWKSCTCDPFCDNKYYAAQEKKRRKDQLKQASGMKSAFVDDVKEENLHLLEFDATFFQEMWKEINAKTASKVTKEKEDKADPGSDPGCGTFGHQLELCGSANDVADTSITADEKASTHSHLLLSIFPPGDGSTQRKKKAELILRQCQEKFPSLYDRLIQRLDERGHPKPVATSQEPSKPLATPQESSAAEEKKDATDEEEANGYHTAEEVVTPSFADRVNTTPRTTNRCRTMGPEDVLGDVKPPHLATSKLGQQPSKLDVFDQVATCDDPRNLSIESESSIVDNGEDDKEPSPVDASFGSSQVFKVNFPSSATDEEELPSVTDDLSTLAGKAKRAQKRRPVLKIRVSKNKRASDSTKNDEMPQTSNKPWLLLPPKPGRAPASSAVSRVASTILEPSQHPEKKPDLSQGATGAAGIPSAVSHGATWGGNVPSAVSRVVSKTAGHQQHAKTELELSQEGVEVDSMLPSKKFTRSPLTVRDVVEKMKFGPRHSGEMEHSQEGVEISSMLTLAPSAEPAPPTIKDSADSAEKKKMEARQFPDPSQEGVENSSMLPLAPSTETESSALTIKDAAEKKQLEPRQCPEPSQEGIEISSMLPLAPGAETGASTIKDAAEKKQLEARQCPEPTQEEVEISSTSALAPSAEPDPFIASKAVEEMKLGPSMCSEPSQEGIEIESILADLAAHETSQGDLSVASMSPVPQNISFGPNICHVPMKGATDPSNDSGASHMGSRSLMDSEQTNKEELCLSVHSAFKQEVNSSDHHHTSIFSQAPMAGGGLASKKSSGLFTSFFRKGFVPMKDAAIPSTKSSQESSSKVIDELSASPKSNSSKAQQPGNSPASGPESDGLHISPLCDSFAGYSHSFASSSKAIEKECSGLSCTLPIEGEDDQWESFPSFAGKGFGWKLPTSQAVQQHEGEIWREFPDPPLHVESIDSKDTSSSASQLSFAVSQRHEGQAEKLFTQAGDKATPSSLDNEKSITQSGYSTVCSSVEATGQTVRDGTVKTQEIIKQLDALAVSTKASLNDQAPNKETPTKGSSKSIRKLPSPSKDTAPSSRSKEVVSKATPSPSEQSPSSSSDSTSVVNRSQQVSTENHQSGEIIALSEAICVDNLDLTVNTSWQEFPSPFNFTSSASQSPSCTATDLGISKDNTSPASSQANKDGEQGEKLQVPVASISGDEKKTESKVSQDLLAPSPVSSSGRSKLPSESTALISRRIEMGSKETLPPASSIGSLKLPLQSTVLTSGSKEVGSKETPPPEQCAVSSSGSLKLPSPPKDTVSSSRSKQVGSKATPPTPSSSSGSLKLPSPSAVPRSRSEDVGSKATPPPSKEAPASSSGSLELSSLPKDTTTPSPPSGQLTSSSSESLSDVNRSQQESTEIHQSGEILALSEVISADNLDLVVNTSWQEFPCPVSFTPSPSKSPLCTTDLGSSLDTNPPASSQTNKTDQGEELQVPVTSIPGNDKEMDSKILQDLLAASENDSAGKAFSALPEDTHHANSKPKALPTQASTADTQLERISTPVKLGTDDGLPISTRETLCIAKEVSTSSSWEDFPALSSKSCSSQAKTQLSNGATKANDVPVQWEKVPTPFRSTAKIREVESTDPVEQTADILVDLANSLEERSMTNWEQFSISGDLDGFDRPKSTDKSKEQEAEDALKITRSHSSDQTTEILADLANTLEERSVCKWEQFSTRSDDCRGIAETEAQAQLEEAPVQWERLPTPFRNAPEAPATPTHGKEIETFLAQADVADENGTPWELFPTQTPTRDFELRRVASWTKGDLSLELSFTAQDGTLSRKLPSPPKDTSRWATKNRKISAKSKSEGPQEQWEKLPTPPRASPAPELKRTQSWPEPGASFLKSSFMADDSVSFSGFPSPSRPSFEKDASNKNSRSSLDESQWTKGTEETAMDSIWESFEITKTAKRGISGGDTKRTVKDPKPTIRRPIARARLDSSPLARCRQHPKQWEVFNPLNFSDESTDWVEPAMSTSFAKKVDPDGLGNNLSPPCVSAVNKESALYPPSAVDLDDSIGADSPIIYSDTMAEI